MRQIMKTPWASGNIGGSTEKPRNVPIFAGRNVLLSGAGILVTIAICLAQTPQATFVELQRHDLTVEKGEGVTTLITIPPGVTSARHSHPGDDFGFLIDGTIILSIDGFPPKTVKAGEPFFTPRGHVHNARNIGTTTARAVDTYVIDKGEPYLIPEKP